MSQPTAPELPSDVRVRWPIVAGIAAALAVLFTIQNYLAPGVQRANDSLARTFALQVIIWTTWLILSPTIFAAARRWRRHPTLTAAAIAQQILASFGVALLHAALAGIARWTLACRSRITWRSSSTTRWWPTSPRTSCATGCSAHR